MIFLAKTCGSINIMLSKEQWLTLPESGSETFHILVSQEAIVLIPRELRLHLLHRWLGRVQSGCSFWEPAGSLGGQEGQT